MTSHECPGPDCGRLVPLEQLACRAHWYQVPKPIRAAVWRAWDYGAGFGTPEHTAAIAAAVARMTRIGAR